jgi:EAL domain-containing protein (putative c-di-GMP-specific phosphodiesterase class I)
MDDFGTGYSSLSQLRSFPFDKIKIDRSFVAGLDGDADGAAVIRAISTLGAGLGMTTIAEGVETTEQASLVTADGCANIQGYLISRPVPAAEVPALISSFGDGKATS